MKNANGTGSIYKKNIKSGVRYVLKVSYWDIEGQKLKRKTKHFKTRKEAEEERQKYLLNKGAYIMLNLKMFCKYGKKKHLRISQKTV